MDSRFLTLSSVMSRFGRRRYCCFARRSTRALPDEADSFSARAGTGRLVAKFGGPARSHLPIGCVPVAGAVRAPRHQPHARREAPAARSMSEVGRGSEPRPANLLKTVFNDAGMAQPHAVFRRLPGRRSGSSPRGARSMRRPCASHSPSKARVETCTRCSRWETGCGRAGTKSSSARRPISSTDAQAHGFTFHPVGRAARETLRRAGRGRREGRPAHAARGQRLRRGRPARAVRGAARRDLRGAA